MKLKFVNIANDGGEGQVYNGLSPYVHWFDRKCSTGLIFHKRIILYCDERIQSFEASIDSEVFTLYDPSKTPTACDCRALKDSDIQAVVDDNPETRPDTGGNTSLCGGEPISDENIQAIIDDDPATNPTPGGNGCGCGCEFIPNKDLTDVFNGIFHGTPGIAGPGRSSDYYNIDGYIHWDIQDVCTNHLQASPQDNWFVLYVVGTSKSPGEYLCPIDLVVNGSRFQIMVGAEFFAKDEVLNINLNNFGVELPDSIGKALYATDLFDDNPDAVILNNKWKELMSNYMDIIGNKGSYKSLLNSLEWFGYGGAVQIKEVWKYTTPGGVKYLQVPIRKAMEEVLEDDLRVFTKTTYYTLSQPAYKDMVIGGLTDYDQPFGVDDVPRHLAIKWSKDEMRIKMTLLGMFLEKYFLPIHLNVWSSVVEDLTITTPPEIITGCRPTVEVVCTNTFNNFEVSIPGHPDNNKSTMDITIPITECHVTGLNPDRLYDSNHIPSDGFYNTADNFTDWGNIPPIVGYSSIEDIKNPVPVSDTDDAWLHFATQCFNGLAATIDITAKFANNVTKGRVITNLPGEVVTRDCVFPTPSKVIRFGLFGKAPGNYYASLEFTDDQGNKYTKIINIDITGNVNVSLQLYRLLPRGASIGDPLPNPFDPSTGVPANIFFRRTRGEVSETPDKEDGGFQVWYAGTDPSSPDVPSLSPVVLLVFDGVDISTLGDGTRSRFLPSITVDGVKYWTRIRTVVTESGKENNAIQAIPAQWISDEDCKEHSVKMRAEILTHIRGFHETSIHISKAFIPEYHRVEKVDDDRTTSYDRRTAFVIVPKIILSMANNETRHIPYSHILPNNQPMWNIRHMTSGFPMADNHTTVDRLTGWTSNTPPPPGAYNVTFKVNFGKDGEGNPVSITRKAMFRLK